jgi:hypothetical protein
MKNHTIKVITANAAGGSGLTGMWPNRLRDGWRGQQSEGDENSAFVRSPSGSVYPDCRINATRRAAHGRPCAEPPRRGTT